MALSPVRLRASINAGSAVTIAFTRSNSPALMASINAAESGIARFYLLTAALIVTMGASVFGQSHLPSQPLLGTALSAELLRELPASGNPFTVLDTMQTEAIGDRFVAAGLNAATPPRLGGLLNSWTQTQIRFGDVTITDARTGGVPLMLPFAPFVSRVTVATGAMAIDDNAPALSMTLEPIAPGKSWQRAFDGAGTGGPLIAGGNGIAPLVDRVDQLGEGSVAFSGPINERVGFAAAGAVHSLSHIEGSSIDAVTNRIASGFAHLAVAPSPTDTFRAIGWLQRTSTPAFEDTGVHAQGAWQRQVVDGERWRVFAGYTERKRTLSAVSQSIVVDSLTTDPVSNLFDSGEGTSRRWTVGARLTPAPNRRWPSVGIDIDNARARVVPSGIGQIRELVDGLPARVWTAIVPSSTDFRHLTTIAAFVDEHLTAGRLTFDAGLRLDRADGAADAADAATHGVSWTTLLPRALVEFHWTRKAAVVLTAGYRRSAYQMPLDVLAIGDPAAPTADVARWNGTTVGPPIARVGPGSGGDAAFSGIDPALDRPVTDELVLAVRAKPFSHFEVELARVTKRESSLLSLVDTGVPFSRYASFYVPDPSYDAATAGPYDRPIAEVFNRPANAYGQDRYLLTNFTGEAAKSWALELNMRATSERVTFLANAALTWAYGSAAAIGYLPTENDQNVLGNLMVDANRESYARGQLFQDRSHVVKMAGVYRFPRRLSVGAIARYQDGQPFARLIAVTQGLTQGPMLIRSYRNGGAAFTYTGTFDIRLQQSWSLGKGDVTLGFDLYNVGHMGKEVDEYVVAGPRFRTPTAIQPPRTALASARFAF